MTDMGAAPGDLVRRARTGDPAAMEALLAEARAVVFRWALLQMGDPDDADDVTQRALMKVQRSIGGFRGESRWTTWLYRLTTNEVRDFGRAKQSRVRMRERLRDLAVGRSHAFECDTNDVVGWVSRFLTELPSMQRQAVDLVDLEGFSPAEAADMLQCNPGTLRVHLHRGRARLRQEIQRVGPLGAGRTE